MSSFSEIYAHLQTFPAPNLPPARARESAVTPKIAALQLHPTLEAALHILNTDLPSAHFLARHMQSAPAFEGMYLHGILHRIEGDYDNARAWYEDVADSDVFQSIWKDRGQKGALDFIDSIQSLKQGPTGSQGMASTESEGQKKLERQSREELEGVMQFCMRKFGTEKIIDASAAWVEPSDKIKSQGQDQVSGDAGARVF